MNNNSQEISRGTAHRNHWLGKQLLVYVLLYYIFLVFYIFSPCCILIIVYEQNSFQPFYYIPTLKEQPKKKTELKEISKIPFPNLTINIGLSINVVFVIAKIPNTFDNKLNRMVWWNFQTQTCLFVLSGNVFLWNFAWYWLIWNFFHRLLEYVYYAGAPVP